MTWWKEYRNLLTILNFPSVSFLFSMMFTSMAKEFSKILQLICKKTRTGRRLAYRHLQIELSNGGLGILYNQGADHSLLSSHPEQTTWASRKWGTRSQALSILDLDSISISRPHHTASRCLQPTRPLIPTSSTLKTGPNFFTPYLARNQVVAVRSQKPHTFRNGYFLPRNSMSFTLPFELYCARHLSEVST